MLIAIVHSTLQESPLKQTMTLNHEYPAHPLLLSAETYPPQQVSQNFKVNPGVFGQSLGLNVLPALVTGGL
jgi:hypothetical protein